VLVETISARRTNRWPFSAEPLPPELIAEINRVAQEYSIWAVFKTTEAEKLPLADLVFQASKVQYGDKSFRTELSNWMRPSSSNLPDGMLGYALLIEKFSSWFAPALVRFTNLSNSQPKKGKSRAKAKYFSSEQTTLTQIV